MNCIAFIFVELSASELRKGFESRKFAAGNKEEKCSETLLCITCAEDKGTYMTAHQQNRLLALNMYHTLCDASAQADCKNCKLGVCDIGWHASFAEAQEEEMPRCEMER